VRGEIDHTARGVLDKALLPENGAGPPRIVIDLGAVTFMDSGGINILISTYRTATDAGGWLRLAAVQTPVLHVLQLVGLNSIITCHPDLGQALSA
jgi:anti-anti-sigma factor